VEAHSDINQMAALKKSPNAIKGICHRLLFLVNSLNLISMEALFMSTIIFTPHFFGKSLSD